MKLAAENLNSVLNLIYKMKLKITRKNSATLNFKVPIYGQTCINSISTY